MICHSFRAAVDAFGVTRPCDSQLYTLRTVESSTHQLAVLDHYLL